MPAQQLSRYVLDNYPTSDVAIFAHENIILSYLGAGDKESAARATNVLLSTFAGHRRASEVISTVAKAYADRQMHEPARDLYKFNLDHYPDANEAVLWVREYVDESLELGDQAGVNAGIDKLLKDYASDGDTPATALRIGAWLFRKDHPLAAELFQHIIDKHPEHELVVPAKVRIGQVMIRRGDDEGAEALFQKVLADYRGHPRLAEAVHLMAAAYLDQSIALERGAAEKMGSANYAQQVREQGRAEAVKDYCRKAIEKWRITIEELPPMAPYTEQAWYFTGVAYRRHLREPEKALTYYQKVAAEWPDYEYAWSAQTMIGLCYENMVDKGQISRQAAVPQIEQAYRAAHEKYPESPLAAQTTLKLAKLSFDSGQWDQAASYYGQFLEKYPNYEHWSQVLLSLGITLEKKGQPLAAAELYRSYLEISDPDDRRVKMMRARLEKSREAR